MTQDSRIQEAMVDLDNPYLAARLAAIQMIAQVKYMPAVPKLIELLADKTRDERTRASAARALGSIGGEEATTALIAVLPEVRPTAGPQGPSGDSATRSLSGILLSLAVAGALDDIGSDETRDALARWNRGEFHKNS